MGRAKLMQRSRESAQKPMEEKNQMNGQDEAKRFAEAIAIANVPTLLMVLVQLTGDLRWLEEPDRPERGRGMHDNDSGGLPARFRLRCATQRLRRFGRGARAVPWRFLSHCQTSGSRCSVRR